MIKTKPVYGRVFTIEPIVKVSSKAAVGLVDRKEGEKIKVIMSFQVIEKTKSYTVLRIGFVQPLKFPSRS